MKVTERWVSDRMQQPITLARWGHFGTPVLVFPTAGATPRRSSETTWSVRAGTSWRAGA